MKINKKRPELADYFKNKNFENVDRVSKCDDGC